MAAFTADQQAIINAMIAEAVAKATAEAAARRPKNDQLRKAFERIDKFEGGAKCENWKEWYYQVVVAASAYDIKHGALLEIVEKLEHDITTTEDLEISLEAAEGDWMHATKAEIFGCSFSSRLGRPTCSCGTCRTATGTSRGNASSTGTTPGRQHP